MPTPPNNGQTTAQLVQWYGTIIGAIFVTIGTIWKAWGMICRLLDRIKRVIFKPYELQEGDESVSMLEKRVESFERKLNAHIKDTKNSLGLTNANVEAIKARVNAVESSQNVIREDIGHIRDDISHFREVAEDTRKLATKILEKMAGFMGS